METWTGGRVSSFFSLPEIYAYNYEETSVIFCSTYNTKNMEEMFSPAWSWFSVHLSPELLLISSQVAVTKADMVLVDLDYSDVQCMQWMLARI